MTHRRAGNALSPLSSSTRILSAIGAVWLGACASTDLEAPLSHPGHPQARAGQVAQTQALSAAYALERSTTPAAAGSGDEHKHHHPGGGAAQDHDADQAPAGAAQDHADQAPAGAAQDHADQAPASAGKGKPAAAAVFTCPMHPEIVRKEAGSCPICGMKLVPKKDAK